MSSQIKSACVAGLSAVAAFLALALPAAAQSNFSGPYIGLGVGYGWNELDTTKTITVPPPPPIIFTDSSVSGVSGSVFAGYNLAIARNIIVGVEGDGTLSSWSHVFHNDDFTSRWNASLRGRLGYELTDRVLVYATGGVSWLHVSVSPDHVGAFGRTLTGWVAGGGVEYNWLPMARLRLEYLYSDYGSSSFDVTPFVSERFNPSLHQIRIGVSIPLGH